MAVDNEKLVRHTFKLLGNLSAASKDELASRARLLALALQQSERELAEAEVRVEMHKEAMEQVLDSIKGHMDVKFKSPKGGYVVDVNKVLKKALSPYADSAYARSVVKRKEKSKKSKKGKKK